MAEARQRGLDGMGTVVEGSGTIRMSACYEGVLCSTLQAIYCNLDLDHLTIQTGGVLYKVGNRVEQVAVFIESPVSS